MAKSREEKDNRKDTEYPNKLKTETMHGILAVVFFVLALFLFMSSLGIGGVAGKFIYDILSYLLGVGYSLMPILFVLLGYSFIKSESPNIGWTRAISSAMFLLSSLGLIDVASKAHSGGFLGRILSTPFVALFDVYASIVFLGAILIISILVMFDAKPQLIPFFKSIWNFINKKKVETPLVLNKNEIKEIDKNLPELEAIEIKGTTEKASKSNKKNNVEDEEMPIKKRRE